MTTPPIYNPVIPCIFPIPGGMFPGRMIRFQGTTPPGARRFAINLQCGPNTDPRDDIAIHVNIRFEENCIVRNTLTALTWGIEETNGGLPLSRGQNFEVLLLCEPQAMKIAINGVHFCEFLHRIPFQSITHLSVDGDCSMQFFGFEGVQPPAQMYMNQGCGGYGAPPAYGAPGYGAPPQGYGTNEVYETQYVTQQRRGLGTGAAVGLGVGALAAGGLAGYALGGGFSSNSPPREEVVVESFSETVDDWME